jgi:hypothetical protein
VGQSNIEAKYISNFWSSLYIAIKPYEYDFPTAILYSQFDLGSSGSTGSRKDPVAQFTLEWTIGCTADHPAIPKSLDLEDDHILARAMSESAKNGVGKLYREADGILTDGLFKEVENGDLAVPYKALIMIPIRTDPSTIGGYLILGLNYYNIECQHWVEVFSHLLGASAASAVLLEEDARSHTRR